jgi:hypothetical protein
MTTGALLSDFLQRACVCDTSHDSGLRFKPSSVLGRHLGCSDHKTCFRSSVLRILPAAFRGNAFKNAKCRGTL